MTTREISNSDDVIDSRDVIARIEELETERSDIAEGLDDVDARNISLAEWDNENGDELKALKALTEEAEGYAPDWQHGAQLIRDSYFVDAMQELLEDIGDLPKDLPGYIVIDWEGTARNLQADYTSVDFDGVTYWVR